MPEYLAQGIAEKLGELAGLAPEEREVVAYGLDYLLSGMTAAALTLLAGFMLGRFAETLAALLCVGLLRIFAGGAHCTARWRCTVTSFAGIIVIVLATKFIYSLVPAMAWAAFSTVWAMVAVWLWAPNNSAREIKDLKRRHQLRRRALIILPLACIILFSLAAGGTAELKALAVAGATGFAAGAFMLSPAGFSLMSFFDQKLALFQITLSKGGEKT